MRYDPSARIKKYSLKDMRNIYYSPSAMAARGSPLKWALLLSVLLFLIGIGIGLTTPTTFSELISAVLQSAKPKLMGKTKLYIAGFIFLHNVTATYMLVVVGALFGVFPAVSIALNGAVIGAVLRGQGVPDFNGTSAFAMRLIPHGIFEMPALLVAAAIGIYVGYAALTFRGFREITTRLKSGSATYILIVLPLLVVAALVESYVDVKSLLLLP